MSVNMMMQLLSISILLLYTTPITVAVSSSKANETNFDTLVGLMRSVRSGLSLVKNEIDGLRTDGDMLKREVRRIADGQKTIQGKIDAKVKELSDKVNDVSAGQTKIQAKVREMAVDQRSIKINIANLTVGHMEIKQKMADGPQATTTKIEAVADGQQTTIVKQITKFIKIEGIGKMEKTETLIETSTPLTFIGKGNQRSGEGLCIANSNTVRGCIDGCWEKQRQDKKWNGIVYRPRAHNCFCIKNDIGHENRSDVLHYRFG